MPLISTGKIQKFAVRDQLARAAAQAGDRAPVRG
jgi:hypothetical protein